MNITENTDYINKDDLIIVNVGSAISPATQDHVLAVTEDIVDKTFTINGKNYLRQNVINQYLNEKIENAASGGTIELSGYVTTSGLTSILENYVTDNELTGKKYISGNTRDVALGEESTSNIVNRINILCESGEYLFKEDTILSNEKLPMVSSGDIIDAKIIVLSNYNSTNSGTTGMIFNITQIMHLSNRTQKNSGIYTRTFSGVRAEISTKWTDWAQISMNKINSFDEINLTGIYQGIEADEEYVIINVNDTQYRFGPWYIEYRIKDIEGGSSSGAYSEWEEYGGGSSLNAIVDGETLVLG